MAETFCKRHIVCRGHEKCLPLYRRLWYWLTDIRSPISWYLGVLVLLVATTAQAQTVVRFQIMPPGHDLKVPSIGQVRYYLLDEYLQLAQFDSELVKLRADVQTQDQMMSGLKKELEAKDVIITNLENDKKILTDRGLRLEQQWKDCEKARASDTGSILPWVVAAGGAVLGIVGVSMYAAERLHAK